MPAFERTMSGLWLPRHYPDRRERLQELDLRISISARMSVGEPSAGINRDARLRDCLMEALRISPLGPRAKATMIELELL